MLLGVATCYEVQSFVVPFDFSVDRSFKKIRPIMATINQVIGIDLLTTVLGYLQFKELESVRGVDTHWKHLSELDGLWRPHVEETLHEKHCLNEEQVRSLMEAQPSELSDGQSLFYSRGNCRRALQTAYADSTRCLLTTQEIFKQPWQLKFRANSSMRFPLDAEPITVSFEGPPDLLPLLPPAEGDAQISSATSDQCVATLTTAQMSEMAMPWECLTPRQCLDSEGNGAYFGGEGGHGGDQVMISHRCGGDRDFMERCTVARKKWSSIRDRVGIQFTCLRVANRPPMRVWRHPEHWGVVLSHYLAYMCAFSVPEDPWDAADRLRRQNPVPGAPPLTPRGGDRRTAPMGAMNQPEPPSRSRPHVDLSKMDPFLETLPKYFHPVLLTTAERRSEPNE